MMKFIVFGLFSMISLGLILKSKSQNSSYVYNPKLKFVKDGWKGNQLDEDSTFVNHEYPFVSSFINFLKWQLEPNPQKEEKIKDDFKLKVHNASEFLKSKEDGIVWVGHATFLIRIAGKLIISDPIFEVPSFFQKRHTELPFNTSELVGIDYIIISHDHPDHLNPESLEIIFKQNPNVKLLTGLRTAQYIEKEFVNNIQFEEAGWYQTFSLTSEDLEITLMPARHWSRRGLFDLKHRLWGSYFIKSDKHSIYFGGDSGFGSHFKEVGDIFGRVEYALIGIGAYKPEWFMHEVHTSPQEALRAADNMQAENMIPMHYATFDLADEPLGDPYRVVNAEYKAKYTSKFNLLNLEIGQVEKLK